MVGLTDVPTAFALFTFLWLIVILGVAQALGNDAHRCNFSVVVLHLLSDHLQGKETPVFPDR